MKKKLSILALFSMFILVACTEDIVQVPNQVIVEGADELGCANVNFKSEASEYVLNLEVEGEWEVFIPKESTWLVAEPASGVAKSKEKVQVVLRAEENVEYKPRKTLVSFSCDKADQKDYVIVTQEQAFFRALEFTHANAKVTGASGKYTVQVIPTNVEAWVGSTDAAWVKVANSGDKAMIINVEENKTGEDRVAKLTMVSKHGKKEYKDELVLTQLGANVTADLVDIVFNEDGTAKDVSPSAREIKSLLGDEVKVEMNKERGVYVATFSHKYAYSCPNGVYYFDELPLREAIKDGFSMEAYVTCGVEPTGSESKVFSSTGNGGSGSGGLALLINSRQLSFLYNGTETGSGSWRFVRSSVTPEVGKWYHVLGTWDQKTNKARIYIDGELKKETDYGKVTLRPSSLDGPYITIGGNSNHYSTYSAPVFNGGWNGSVAIARMYSDPITDAGAKAAYINAQQGKIQLYD